MSFLWETAKTIDGILDDVLAPSEEELTPEEQIQMALTEANHNVIFLDRHVRAIAMQMKDLDRQGRVRELNAKAEEMIMVQDSLAEMTEMQSMMSKFQTQYVLMQSQKSAMLALEHLADRMIDMNSIQSVASIQRVAMTYATQKRKNDLRMRLMNRTVRQTTKAPAQSARVAKLLEDVRKENMTTAVLQLPEPPSYIPRLDDQDALLEERLSNLKK